MNRRALPYGAGMGSGAGAGVEGTVGGRKYVPLSAGSFGGKISYLSTRVLILLHTRLANLGLE
jgi:hypothetical protein